VPRPMDYMDSPVCEPCPTLRTTIASLMLVTLDVLVLELGTWAITLKTGLLRPRCCLVGSR
jgi:hypothetical protein